MRSWGILLGALLLALALAGGCLSASFGQVTYGDGVLGVSVRNAGVAEDAALQVNVFRFQDFRQVEVTRRILPVRLETGVSFHRLPLALAPGTYRLYLYIVTGDERRAGMIRDITVEDHGATPRIGTG